MRLVTLVQIDIEGLMHAMCEECATQLLEAATAALMNHVPLDPQLCVEDSALWRAHIRAKIREELDGGS